jgi:putative MATE family efflux protein
LHDLTRGSISRHLIQLAIPLAAGMVFQTLYYLVDLYFVAQLGDSAIAGVGAAGNVQFIVMSLTQVLGVGTMALIAHAVGRKDREDANLIFNQSVGLALLAAIVTLIGGYALTGAYMGRLGADRETMAAGTTYLRWFLPGLALQFALVVMGSALRGTGIVKPAIVVQIATVVVNAILAPVLIAGWVTGLPLGVAGAGLATSAAIGLGVIMLWAYFRRLEKYVGFDRAMAVPRPGVWKRILAIGLPPGGEFALMFLNMAVIYWVIRGFGAEAQAGYGIGTRVMQAIFLPAMAIAFAVAPLAGQNVGAGKFDRVWASFRAAAGQGGAIMLLLTLVCQWRPEWLVGAFTAEPETIAVGAQFLRYISWNFVAVGVVFTCSGMFQALGNTVPSLLSGVTRLVTFVGPAIWMSRRPGFQLAHLWLLSVATTALQAGVSLWLLRSEARRMALRRASRAGGPEASPISA